MSRPIFYIGVKVMLSRIMRWFGCFIILAATTTPQGCDTNALQEATIAQLTSSLTTIVDSLVTTFVYNAFDIPNVPSL